MAAGLREVLELGIAGSGHVSMQACGIKPKVFLLNETFSMDELCLRWYQLAAFMPALHSMHDALGSNATLPHGFSKYTYTSWVRRALQRRAKLAPYMYTQMYLATLKGTPDSGVPLVRPLFVEFPDDLHLNNDFFVWNQFMFGQAVLVNPVVEPEARDQYCKTLSALPDDSVPTYKLWPNFKQRPLYTRPELQYLAPPPFLMRLSVKSFVSVLVMQLEHLLTNSLFHINKQNICDLNGGGV